MANVGDTHFSATSCQFQHRRDVTQKTPSSQPRSTPFEPASESGQATLTHVSAHRPAVLHLLLLSNLKSLTALVSPFSAGRTCLVKGHSSQIADTAPAETKSHHHAPSPGSGPFPRVQRLTRAAKELHGIYKGTKHPSPRGTGCVFLLAHSDGITRRGTDQQPPLLRVQLHDHGVPLEGDRKDTESAHHHTRQQTLISTLLKYKGR